VFFGKNLLPFPGNTTFAARNCKTVACQAFLAQLVEQLIRNQQVAGSSPVEGSVIFCLLFGRQFLFTEVPGYQQMLNTWPCLWLVSGYIFLHSIGSKKTRATVLVVALVL
jgi:hypothetical protein